MMSNKPQFVGEKVRLGDVVRIEKAPSPSGDTVWLLNLDAVEKNTGRVLEKTLVSAASVGSSTTAFTSNAVLYSKLRPNLNKVVLPDGNGLATSEMLPLIPRADVLDKRYLAFLLRSKAFVNLAVSSTAGSKMPRLSKRVLLDAAFPIPSLDTQHYRVALLSSIEEAQFKANQRIAQLNSLVKSRFVEMFGDPCDPKDKRERNRLDSFCELRIGPFGSALHKEDYITGGHPLVNPSHIANGAIRPESNLTISEEKYESLAAYHLHPGDVVLGRRGEIGRCAVVDKSGMICGTGSMILRPSQRVRSDYLRRVVSFPSFSRALENNAVGVTMKNLNAKIVGSAEVYLPKLADQDTFIAFVAQVDKSRFAYIRSQAKSIEQALSGPSLTLVIQHVEPQTRSKYGADMLASPSWPNVGAVLVQKRRTFAF